MRKRNGKIFWRIDTETGIWPDEAARNHGKSIIVMEPVKGGALANPPKAVQDIFRKANPEASFASWAIRYAASLEGIITVLSGMSNVAQMEQGKAEYARAVADVGTASDCIACGQCERACPRQIPVVDRLKDCAAAFGK